MAVLATKEEHLTSVENVIKKLLENYETFEKCREVEAKDDEADALSCFYHPFFRDAGGATAPMDTDSKKLVKHKEMLAVNEDNLWFREDQYKLKKAVHVIHVNKQCEEPDKTIVTYMGFLSHLKDDDPQKAVVNQKIEEAMEQRKRITRAMEVNRLIGRNVLNEMDWMAISCRHMDGKHSAKSCRNMWTNLLHPNIDQSPITQREVVVISEHLNNNRKDYIGAQKALGDQRTVFQVITAVKRHESKKLNPFTWSDDQQLLQLVNQFRNGDSVPWTKVANNMVNRTREECYNRYIFHARSSLKKNNFTREEDVSLLAAFRHYGSHYHVIACFLPHRSYNHIRHRYRRFLNLDIKLADWTGDEDRKLVQCVEEYERSHENGNRSKWSKIAEKVKGRIPADVRDRYLNIMGRHNAGGKLVDDLSASNKTLIPTKFCKNRLNYRNEVHTAAKVMSVSDLHKAFLNQQLMIVQGVSNLEVSGSEYDDEKESFEEEESSEEDGASNGDALDGCMGNEGDQDLKGTGKHISKFVSCLIYEEEEENHTPNILASMADSMPEVVEFSQIVGSDNLVKKSKREILPPSYGIRKVVLKLWNKLSEVVKPTEASLEDIFKVKEMHEKVARIPAQNETEAKKLHEMSLRRSVIDFMQVFLQSYHWLEINRRSKKENGGFFGGIAKGVKEVQRFKRERSETEDEAPISMSRKKKPCIASSSKSSKVRKRKTESSVSRFEHRKSPKLLKRKRETSLIRSDKLAHSESEEAPIESQQLNGILRKTSILKRPGTKESKRKKSVRFGKKKDSNSGDDICDKLDLEELLYTYGLDSSFCPEGKDAPAAHSMTASFCPSSDADHSDADVHHETSGRRKRRLKLSQRMKEYLMDGNLLGMHSLNAERLADNSSDSENEEGRRTGETQKMKRSNSRKRKNVQKKTSTTNESLTSEKKRHASIRKETEQKKLPSIRVARKPIKEVSGRNVQTDTELERRKSAISKSRKKSETETLVNAVPTAYVTDTEVDKIQLITNENQASLGRSSEINDFKLVSKNCVVILTNYFGGGEEEKRQISYLNTSVKNHVMRKTTREVAANEEQTTDASVE